MPMKLKRRVWSLRRRCALVGPGTKATSQLRSLLSITRWAYVCSRAIRFFTRRFKRHPRNRRSLAKKLMIWILNKHSCRRGCSLWWIHSGYHLIKQWSNWINLRLTTLMSKWSLQMSFCKMSAYDYWIIRNELFMFFCANVICMFYKFNFLVFIF